MLFKNITILDEDLAVRENMYVGTKDDRIDYIGAEEPGKDYGDIIDGKDRCLMSGFVNAHGHSPMTLMRGYGEDMTLQDWLFGIQCHDAGNCGVAQKRNRVDQRHVLFLR